MNTEPVENQACLIIFIITYYNGKRLFLIYLTFYFYFGIAVKYFYYSVSSLGLLFN